MQYINLANIFNLAPFNFLTLFANKKALNPYKTGLKAKMRNMVWRKERNSNPRMPHDVNSFQDCRNKPDSAILPCVTKKNILS